MAVSMAVPAMAAEPAKELVNPDKPGTITVTMKTSDGTYVPGGELSLYQVATVKPGDDKGNAYHFQYTSDFKGLEQNAEIPKISDNDTKLKDLEKTIAQYQEDNKIDPVAKADIGTEDDELKGTKKGVAVFKQITVDGKKQDLTAGVYLVRQTKAASGYYPVSPFLITVPTLKADGSLNYDPNTADFDATAEPKVEPVTPTPYNPGPTTTPTPTATPTPTETPTPTPGPGQENPSIKKVISGDTPSSAALFTFTLTAAKDTNPMPEGSKDGKKTIQINGAGTVDFGLITFKTAGTYEYKVQEVRGNAKGYKYDQTEYKLVYTVTDDLKITKAVFKGNDKVSSNDVMTFTNQYTKQKDTTPTVTPGKPVRPSRPSTPSTPRTTTTPTTTVKKASVLPQTGQLWWPVWVLMAAGGVLIVSGMVKKKKEA